MATYRHIVYTVLDEIKSVNGDSYITEEHVMFLADQYRLFFLLQKILKEGIANLSTSLQQVICLDLEKVDAVPGLACLHGLYLKSIQEVPTIMSGTSPSVFPYNYFDTYILYISKDRMKYVGYNKYLKSIIYCTIFDNHLYIKGYDPQSMYLQKVMVQGVFEDAQQAAMLSCEENQEDACKDLLDKDFPLSGDLIPSMILALVKELYSALIKPADTINNANDDIADIIAYVKRNMKSELSKQISE